MQQLRRDAHVDIERPALGRPTVPRESLVQARRSSVLAGVAGIVCVIAGAVGGVAAAAAPKPVPTRSATPVPSVGSTAPVARPSMTAAPPSPVATRAPVIAVPAGRAEITSSNGDASSAEIVTLIAFGVLLAGGGAVVATRRRP
jgi:hypothetical protein